VTQRSNLTINERATTAAQKRARAEVRAVYQYVEAGTPLVKAGETITPEKWEQLQAIGLVNPRLDWKIALTRLMLCALLVLAAAAYLSLFRRDLIEQPAVLWLIAMIPVLFVLVFRMLAQVPHADLAMVPLAATAAMLLTILIDARLGMVAGFVVAALCTIMGRTGIDLFLTSTLSAWIGALAVSNIASRGQLVRAAVLLVIANASLTAGFSVLALNGWHTMPDAEETLSLIAWSAIAGLFSVFATAGLAMLLERPFGITTHLRLLELLAPEEVVLRRMQAEAPGTYTHSLMVSMLSETAAKAVGADPLLCRVGGLYHDIGKLRRPHCFIENQSGENIHDRLSPQLSASVILAHVKDGLELGRALHLPQPVMDIIAQHHGTSLISYFYNRAAQDVQIYVAVEESEETAPDQNGSTAIVPANGVGEIVRNGTAKIDEAAFRYPGPRPQSKEAAIVMLADTIEASARSLPNLSPERLARHINAMIAQRLQEGELSECEVTLRDLGKIEDSFVHVLRGVLHHRIEYPDPKRELEKVRDDSNTWVREALADSFSSSPGEYGSRPHHNRRAGDRRTNGAVNPESEQRNDSHQETGGTSSRRKRRRAARNAAQIQDQLVKVETENDQQAAGPLPKAPSHSPHG
jgi:putative nucleotidyltransferase with HDIG domain